MAKEIIYLHAPHRCGTSSLKFMVASLGFESLKCDFSNEEHIRESIKLIEEMEKQGNCNFLMHKALKKQPEKEKFLNAINSSSKKKKVITIIREPISFSFSHFFKHMDGYLDFYNLQRNYTKVLPQIKDIYLRAVESYLTEESATSEIELIRLLFDKIDRFLKIDIPELWDINVFKKADTNIYESNKAKLLLLKLEELRIKGRGELKHFLGTSKHLKTHFAQKSSGQRYGRAFRMFKETIVLPRKFIKKMYDLDYVKCFYTPEEINVMKKKWFNRI